MLNRRNFIKTSVYGSLAAAIIPSQAMNAIAKPTDAPANAILNPNSTVSLSTGANRAETAFRALQPLAKEIAQAVGNKRIIVKPNMVTSTIQLSAIHKDTIEGILEFYKSIGKLGNVVIAESTADGPAMTAYDNYGYIPVANKYKVKLMDLDEAPPKLLYVMDELDIRPKPVRMTSMLMDRNNFVMSVARMKTHDRVVATLSLKNVALAAPIKDPGYGWGASRKPGAKSDKAIVHGSGFRAINYNLFNLAFTIRPDLAFIDGFEGMEGDGPNNGTPVDHRIAVAALDWMAADRVGVELMGIDSSKIGYLNFCASAGMGQFDLSKIDVVGEKLADHIKHYKLSRNIEKELQWLKPLKEKEEALY